MPADVFTTGRLAVRQWRSDDAEAAYEIYRHWEVTRWLGSAPTPVTSVDQMRERVTRWMAPPPIGQDPAFGFWALTLRARTAPIGAVLLKPLPPGQSEIEIGWHLRPDQWGHGYATEAGTAAAERGFAAGLDAVYAVVRTDNERSMATARRIGMTHLGQTDDYYDAHLELFRLRPGDVAGMEHRGPPPN
ncbi:MAG: GNAT family N-acetyltransferase [Pseudonocardiales bacterium]|nr:MAG: GNAT family N-acetyltransferase [Pseudonocardiales bacterium]